MLRKIKINQIIVKKTKNELTDKDWVVLEDIFLHKDLAKLFESTVFSIAGKVKNAKNRYEEMEHPVEQGRQLLQAMEQIVERGKMIQKSGVKTELPALGLLAQIAVWTQIDIIKDSHSTRKDKINAAAELRKFLETSMGMRDNFLKTEAMSRVIAILKQIIGELSPPLQEVFAEKILANEELRFLIKGF